MRWMNSTESSRASDFLQNLGATAALFGLPVVAIVASGFLAPGSPWRSIVWAAALATMGFACTLNALRCGRVHCYITGPLYLLGALVALLSALAIVHLNQTGWNVFAGGLILFTCLAYCFESVFGRYRRA
jgi:hypothetical protein